MIQYVFGQKSEYFEKYDDPTWDEEDDDFMLSAFEQAWDEATIKQLRDEYNIIFNCGVHPILVLGRGSDHPLLVVGSEDDGTICFRRRYGQFENCFSPYWADHLIENLREAVEFSGFSGLEMK